MRCLIKDGTQRHKLAARWLVDRSEAIKPNPLRAQKNAWITGGLRHQMPPQVNNYSAESSHFCFMRHPGGPHQSSNGVAIPARAPPRTLDFGRLDVFSHIHKLVQVDLHSHLYRTRRNAKGRFKGGGGGTKKQTTDHKKPQTYKHIFLQLRLVWRGWVGWVVSDQGKHRWCFWPQ